jgi:hypothetical protein
MSEHEDNHRKAAAPDQPRKPWATPVVITSMESSHTHLTFKSNPSWVDYTTGITHVGGS